MEPKESADTRLDRMPASSIQLARAQPFTVSGHQTTVASKKQRPRDFGTARPAIDEYLLARERMNRVSAEFLKIDIEMAFTFLGSARQTASPEREQRNRRAARQAYNTVRRLVGRVSLNEEDTRRIVLGLERLKSELENLGESF